jgi:zinc/manganese transport system substrate-binding protein
MILEKGGRVTRALMIGAVLAGSALALASCGSSSSTPGVVNVVGAENQYGDVLAQIGGAYVHVTSVMNNPNTDPHNFEASPRVAQEIASAQLIVQNGDGYDAFMNQLESASPSSARRVLSVASFDEGVSALNPHLWYSPSTMPLVAKFVTNDLATIAPKHAGYFRAREAAFDRQWATVLSAISSVRHLYAGQEVATTEPVADYLISAMGLNNATPFRFQADVMNGIDPSPQDIVIQEHLLSTHAVKAFCFNAQVSSPVTRALLALATKEHVPTVAVYETMPVGFRVQDWMIAEINAVQAALGDGQSTVSLH